MTNPPSSDVQALFTHDISQTPPADIQRGLTDLLRYLAPLPEPKNYLRAPILTFEFSPDLTYLVHHLQVNKYLFQACLAHLPVLETILEEFPHSWHLKELLRVLCRIRSFKYEKLETDHFVPSNIWAIWFHEVQTHPQDSFTFQMERLQDTQLQEYCRATTPEQWSAHLAHPDWSRLLIVCQDHPALRTIIEYLLDKQGPSVFDILTQTQPLLSTQTQSFLRYDWIQKSPRYQTLLGIFSELTPKEHLALVKGLSKLRTYPFSATCPEGLTRIVPKELRDLPPSARLQLSIHLYRAAIFRDVIAPEVFLTQQEETQLRTLLEIKQTPDRDDLWKEYEETQAAYQNARLGFHNASQWWNEHLRTVAPLGGNAEDVAQHLRTLFAWSDQDPVRHPWAIRYASLFLNSWGTHRFPSNKNLLPLLQEAHSLQVPFFTLPSPTCLTTAGGSPTIC